MYIYIYVTDELQSVAIINGRHVVRVAMETRRQQSRL